MSGDSRTKEDESQQSVPSHERPNQQRGQPGGSEESATTPNTGESSDS